MTGGFIPLLQLLFNVFLKKETASLIIKKDKLTDTYFLLCYSDIIIWLQFDEIYSFRTLTLSRQSAKVHITKLAGHNGSGKELIMAMNIASINILPVMGSSYYFYFKACFFAGLFRRAKILLLSGI